MKSIKNYNYIDFIQKNMAWFILAIIVIVFSIFSEKFFTINNMLNIITQNAYVIVASLGISFIMMSGNIDLSIGYQMSLNSIVCALLLTKLHVPTIFVVLIAIALGIVLSFVNTLVSILLKLPRMMVSLATMAIYQGMSYVISESKSISDFPSSFKFIGQGYIGALSFSLILAFVLFFIMSFVLNRTYFGRYVYALGGNVEAARLAGINVSKVNWLISAIAGGFVGLASIMLISRLGSASSSTGPGTEFTVLTGMLLGGVSIRGGEGKLSGVLAGIFILSILSNGMQLAGLGIYLQYIAKGIIMLAAIGFDVYQMKRRQFVKANDKNTV